MDVRKSSRFFATRLTVRRNVLELAAIDAAAALHHMGHPHALLALEASKGKGAHREALGMVREEAESAANQLPESEPPGQRPQRPDLQSDHKSMRKAHSVPCPEISIEFKYSLLCYAGALLQHSAVRHEVVAFLIDFAERPLVGGDTPPHFVTLDAG